MILDNNKFLGGHLVGIGKVRANGEVEYKELEKPIHNRITSVGLDHLFLFGGADQANANNGANADMALWVGNGRSAYSSYKYRAGALEYMSYGSGTTATAFTDTDLSNGSGSYSNTKQTSSATAQTLNGTKVNSYGNYSFRVTHKSAAAAATTTVNEIGWYGAYTNNTSSITPGAANTTMVLFARVVLPSPITLNSGEYLLTTYQLDETNANTIASTISDFFGLKDSNGNTLQAQQKVIRKQNTTSGVFQCTLNEPYITYSGSFGNANYYRFFPAFVFSENSYYTGQSFGYSTNSSMTFPADGSSDESSLTRFDASGSKGTNWNVDISSYTGVGSTNKYRDRTYTTGAYNPNMLSNPTGYTDIYYINVNGMAYRFGYYDNGVWVPQAWRKYANQAVTFTFRTRYSTPDTTLS